MDKLKNIGPKISGALDKLGLKTVGDILYHVPVRFVDFSNIKKIGSIKIGEEVTIFGEIVSCASRQYSRIGTVTCVIKDETSMIPAVWFNQPYLANTFKPGTRLFLSGKLVKKYGRVQLENPIYEIADEDTDLTHTGRIIPVHAATAGITKRQLRTIIKKVAVSLGDIEDPLAKYRESDMPGLSDSINKAHFPDNLDESYIAIDRFAWEELFYFFLMQKIKRSLNSAADGIKHENRTMAANAIAGLPFKLTNQQELCLKNIFSDMESGSAMDRVIQGDVGSGKTIVAFLAMIKAAGSGGQSVLMAPTEILAEQHFKRFKSFFEGMDITALLLTGSVKQSDRKIILDSIKNGEADVVIGTHAVIQDSIDYKNLSLVVIDEQHRFGVVQREKLKKKSKITPDYLMLTATPIPRTMFSIAYADVDVDIIDEFPSSKRCVETKVMARSQETDVVSKVKSLISTGRQAFIVCPVIEEGDNLELQAVEKELSRWAKALYPFRIGKMHGKLSSVEKQSVMEDFSAGFLDVLICTSVIEVGIDVPNATVMVINNADRFGLAQLHQMRGRVGRGGNQSYCYLMCAGGSAVSKQRLKALEQHNDGFKLSEIDLQLRGEGEIFGLKQWGKNQFKFVDMVEHSAHIKNTKQLIEDIYVDLDSSGIEPIALELQRRYPMHKELIHKFADNRGKI